MNTPVKFLLRFFLVLLLPIWMTKQKEILLGQNKTETIELPPHTEEEMTKALQ